MSTANSHTNGSFVSPIWTDSDSEIAHQEGWNLFCAEGTEFGFTIWQVQREDDLDVFEDDTSALKSVFANADKGSELHRRALALHMTLV